MSLLYSPRTIPVSTRDYWTLAYRAYRAVRGRGGDDPYYRSLVGVWFHLLRLRPAIARAAQAAYEARRQKSTTRTERLKALRAQLEGKRLLAQAAAATVWDQMTLRGDAIAIGDKLTRRATDGGDLVVITIERLRDSVSLRVIACRADDQHETLYVRKAARFTVLRSLCVVLPDAACFPMFAPSADIEALIGVAKEASHV